MDMLHLIGFNFFISQIIRIFVLLNQNNMKKSLLSLNIQHDYITLRTPNGNYTTKWSGAKASGKMATHPTAFKNIDTYVQTERKSRKLGDVMLSLTDPKILSSLWSEWNESIEPNLFLPTNQVVFKESSLFTKRYPKGGIVKKVARKTVYIHLLDTNEIIGFDYQTLKKV